MLRRMRRPVVALLVLLAAGCESAERTRRQDLMDLASAAADADLAGASADAGADLAGAPDLTTGAQCNACSAYGPAIHLADIDDPEDNDALAITELSGIAASWRNPGLYYVHNDDGNTVYAINTDGRVVAVMALTGAAADNFEDLAVGPCPDGTCLFAGNIGDNNAGYSARQIHRFAEPELDAAGAEQSVAIDVETIVFDYADGPHNAEALLVHPTSGDLYIVTKAATAGVYKIAAADATTSGTRTFEKVGTIDLALVTGGDLHPCGTRAILRNLGGIYELRLPAGAPSFDGIWSEDPTTLPRPTGEGQGEAVGYDRDGLGYVLTYEGDAPVELNQVRCQ